MKDGLKTIWVDADATPRSIRDVLCRASVKRGVSVHFVANRPLAMPRGHALQMTTVGSGADVADDFIADQCSASDLVITADVPLAARVISKGGTVLRPRGKEITEENVDEALSLRNFSESLRSGGVQTGGPPPLTTGDVHAFSNALDRWLTRNGF